MQPRLRVGEFVQHVHVVGGRNRFAHRHDLGAPGGADRFVLAQFLFDFREVGRIVVEALAQDADVPALRARAEALCAKRPLYPGFRGYTTYVAEGEKG